MLKNIFIISIICTLFSCGESEWQIKEVHGSKVSIDSIIPPDQDITAIIAPYKIQLDTIMSEVLCQSKTAIKHFRPESPLGNFVADLSYKTALEHGFEVDMCLLNHFGLRTELMKGTITKRHAYQLMPFENELVAVDLNATAMLELFAYLKKSKGHPIANAKLTFSNQQDQILINNVLWDPQKTYSILTTDYLAKGGDKMNFFEKGNIKPTGIKLRDAIIDFMSIQDTIHPKTDDRFVFLDENTSHSKK